MEPKHHGDDVIGKIIGFVRHQSDWMLQNTYGICISTKCVKHFVLSLCHSLSARQQPHEQNV